MTARQALNAYPQGSGLRRWEQSTGPLLLRAEMVPHTLPNSGDMGTRKRKCSTCCFYRQGPERPPAFWIRMKGEASSASRSLDIRAENPDLSSSTQQLISLQKCILLPGGIWKDLPASVSLICKTDKELVLCPHYITYASSPVYISLHLPFAW